jgi:hypothetical protein
MLSARRALLSVFLFTFAAVASPAAADEDLQTDLAK